MSNLQLTSERDIARASTLPAPAYFSPETFEAEKASLFAHDLGRAFFQAIYGRIFAINVVADFSFRHGAPHGRRRTRNSVAS